MKANNGDIIRTRPHAYWWLIHSGILIVKDGQVLVSHNVSEGGPRIDTLEDFLSTRTLLTVEPSTLNGTPPDEIIERHKRAPRYYDLIKYNCEHYIHQMQGLLLDSPQINWWIACIAFCLMIYIIY